MKKNYIFAYDHNLISNLSEKDKIFKRFPLSSYLKP